MIQRCGFFSPAWDFSAGPALVRAHFLAFSATHGWGLGEGDCPVVVWMLPDYQDPQLLKEAQERTCAKMLEEDMAVVGSTSKPIPVDMGRTLKCKVGTTVRTLPTTWMNEPQQFKVRVVHCGVVVGGRCGVWVLLLGSCVAALLCLLHTSRRNLTNAWHGIVEQRILVPVTAREGEIQQQPCFLFRVDETKKRRPDPCGSFDMSLMIVSRLPPRPHRFRLQRRLRHSTVFEWQARSQFEQLGGEFVYNLCVLWPRARLRLACTFGSHRRSPFFRYMANLTLEVYSRMDEVMRQERAGMTVLDWELYWTGSENQLEIDNDFYAAVFKITASNYHGESLPSNLVMVHPSTQFADDRLKLSRAVRTLEVSWTHKSVYACGVKRPSTNPPPRLW